MTQYEKSENLAKTSKFNKLEGKNMKYTVEITKSKMIKTLEFEGKEYKEEWHVTPAGARTKGEGITSQIVGEGAFTDELIECLESEDFYDVWMELRGEY